MAVREAVGGCVSRGQTVAVTRGGATRSVLAVSGGLPSAVTRVSGRPNRREAVSSRISGYALAVRRAGRCRRIAGVATEVVR